MERPLSNLFVGWPINKQKCKYIRVFVLIMCTELEGSFDKTVRQKLWYTSLHKSSSSEKRDSHTSDLPCISEENENVNEENKNRDEISKALNDSHKTKVVRQKAGKGQENQGRADAGKYVKPPSSRFSKAKLSCSSSLTTLRPVLSERQPRHNNIVSNITSFVPLVQQQKRAASVITGKRNVKVKSLEAAEATKRIAEQKENDRKMKKEAMKLERARLEQEKLRKQETENKKKEEEQTKKAAEMALKQEIV